MGGGGKKSTPSGTSDAMKGFEEIGDLSKAQLESQYGMADERQFYDQDQWRKNKERLSGIDDSMLDYSENSIRRAEEDRGRYEELYQPIEEQYLDKVKNFDTAERRTTEAAAAQTEVASQSEAARQNALRSLEAYGVDPSQTRYSALDANLRIEEAKAKAGAATGARRDIEQTGMALEQGTVGQGRGLDAMGKGNFAAGAGAIPEFGQGAGELYSQGQAAGNTWGESLGSLATASSANQSNKNSASGDLMSAGLTAGAMMMMADGGEVDGPGGPTDDAIDAKLSDGEFIIPADVVKRKGTEFFDKLIQKVKTENAEREENAQVTDEAMGIPPPEVVPPNMGMYKGGEVLNYAQGGEVLNYAQGGWVDGTAMKGDGRRPLTEGMKNIQDLYARKLAADKLKETEVTPTVIPPQPAAPAPAPAMRARPNAQYIAPAPTRGDPRLAIAKGGEVSAIPTNPDIRAGYAMTRDPSAHAYAGPETKWPAEEYPPPPNAVGAN